MERNALQQFVCQSRRNLPFYEYTFVPDVLRALCDEGASASEHFTIIHWITGWTKDPRYFPICVEGLKLLLKHGAPLSRALHAVPYCSNTFVPLIKVLLDAGADIEETWNDKTPLSRAAYFKNAAAVKALLDAGAKVDGPGNECVLFKAIKDAEEYPNEKQILGTLKTLCDAGAKVNHRNECILSHAMQYNCVNTRGIVETLCSYGSDVNFRHDWYPMMLRSKSGDTPLHRAASIRSTNCTKILISYGANVDSQNDAGQTPLHRAVRMADIVTVKVLVKHGARTDLEDIKGRTALMLAESMDPGDEKIVDFLLKQEKR
jgi:ankyrin repeat protein